MTIEILNNSSQKSENLSNLYPSLRDELEGAIRRHKLWLYLAWSDIRQRYRGSVLGPLWITLSTAIFVTALSIINAELFKSPPEKYIPMLSTGFVIWYFISGTLSESTGGLVAGKGLISQISLPFFIHLLRVICRNFLILLHNCIVLLFVFAYFKIFPTTNTLFVIPGGILVCFFLTSSGMILAMIGARFRDMQQVIASLLQVLFFVSPITWEAKQISTATWVLYANPIFYLIDAIRAPLLGQPLNPNTLPVLSTITLVSCALSIWLFNKKREKIPFWVQ
jgi:ABC-type polysaccharide/polyol phosphate export permease